MKKILYAILIGIFLISPTLATIQKTGSYPEDSFVDPSVIIDVKDFSIGEESYIAPFTRFVGEYVVIGNYSNIQDGGDNRGNITIANDAVVAHGADLVGKVEIENRAFIGFNSIIQDSKIGEGAYIGIRSKIIGVEIPAGKTVPPGTIIDRQASVENLQDVTQEQEDFVNEVIEVNRALAIGYSRLFKEKGLTAFQHASPNGDGDILVDEKDILTRNDSEWPVIGNNTIIGDARIIGYVIIGGGSKIGNRTSIRGDEGVPIEIGKNANIGEDNTFHSLNDKYVKIGDNLNVRNDAVIHGPLEIGSNVVIGSRAVVFKSKIGNDVAIGDKSIIVGVEIPDGAIIPANQIITDQKAVDNVTGKTEPEKTKTIVTPAEKTPGFDGTIGIIGLLSMLYLLRRNR